MLDIISKLMSGDTAKWLLLAVVVINAILSSLSVGLELIGKSEKAPAWLKKAAEISKKIVDFLSANIPHK